MRHPTASRVIRSLSALTAYSGEFARYLSLAAVVLILFLAAGGRAFAASHPRVARLSHAVGNVQILRGDKTEFEQALANMPLPEDTRLQSGEDGRAEVQFDNGSIARIAPNSSMSLNQIQRGLEGAEITQVELLTGLGYFELRSRGGEDSVRFGGNVVTPLEGSATVRINMGANPAELSVLEGNVHVAGGTQFAVDVHNQETIRFDATDSSRYYLTQGVTADSWDTWNSDREQTLTQQALKRTDARDMAANSADPGWGDLDEYGDWYSMPGYGNVWTPYGVGAGWDPYGSGYWGYYPGSGYMWISGYSWGWLPYRCGGWNYFNSFGWGWMPVNCGLGWNPGIMIWNSPQGYRPPPRPRPHGMIARDVAGNQRLIRVDRGPQASQLLPREPGVSQGSKAIVLNGVTIRPLQAKPLPGSTFVGGAPHPVVPVQPLPRPGGSSMRVPYNPPGTRGTPPAVTPVPRTGSPVSPGITPTPRTVTPVPSPPSVSMPAPSPRMATPAPTPAPAPRVSAPPVQHYSAPAPPVRYSAPPASMPSGGRTSSPAPSHR